MSTSDFKVWFEKTAHVRGRDKSWAMYYWNPNENYWYCTDGQSSEGFFNINPEFSRKMPDTKIMLYSLK